MVLPLRRMKTYTGQTGYVYQYYFVGKRAALLDDPQHPAAEFIFDVSPDRKVTFAVSVFLPESARAQWASAHGRMLNDAEQYAAAKLCLMRGFDEIADMQRQGRRLALDAGTLEELLAGLGLE